MGLREGKISNKELAEWFGISANSFSKNKEKKLEELKYFAEFHIDNKNHVIIDKVYNDVYNRQGKANYQKIKEKIDNVWNKDGLDSCKRVGEEIYKDLIMEDEDFKLKPSTVYNYTREGRNELYGKPFVGGGKIGSCIYLWCKKEDDGSYSMLSEEEKKIKEDLQIKYFGDTTEKQILVKAMIEAGEISKEEAWSVLEEMTNMKNGNFLLFLGELQEKIGCKVVRGTLVQRNQDALEINAFCE